METHTFTVCKQRELTSAKSYAGVPAITTWHGRSTGDDVSCRLPPSIRERAQVSGNSRTESGAFALFVEGNTGALALGTVHGHVGLEQEVCRIARAFGIECDADTGIDLHHMRTYLARRP